MIGFYDSGIGGLTILEQVLKLDSSLKYAYFADLAILPLGEKSVDFIQNRVKQACTFLFENGCEIVVLACNTASVNSIRNIQQVWLPLNYPSKQVLSITKPFTEMLEDGYQYLKSKNGLILSTKATHNSGFYQYEFIKLGFTNLKSVACNGLANAIEQENTDEINSLIQTYILENKIQTKSIDYILLACTHYKYTIKQIQEKFPNAIILEPSKTVSKKLISYLENHPKYKISDGNSKYYSTSATPTALQSIKKISPFPILEYVNM